MTLKAWTRTVQGHPRSKVIVPIGSSLMISYMISIVSNVVFLTAFDLFDVKVLWPISTTVQGHPRSNGANRQHTGDFVLTSTDNNIVSVTIFEIFDDCLKPSKVNS